MPQSILNALPTPSPPGQVPQVNQSDLQPSTSDKANDTFSSLIDQAKKDSDELKQKGRDASARIEANENKIEGLKAPKTPELTPAPKPKESDPFQAFGSAAGWIAVFGSMLTREPLTAALNASAGAMNAVKQNNAQDFQQKMDEWKANTENALKLHQFEMDAYKEDLEKLKAGDQSALTDIQVTAASFKNDTLQVLAAKGQTDAAIKQMEAQAKMGEQMAKSADRGYQIALAQQDIMTHPDWTPQQKAQRYAEATNPAAMTTAIKADEKKEENADKSKPTYDDAMIAKAGQAILDGVRPNVAVPGYGAKNPNRDAALKWASDHAAPGWSMADAEVDYLGRTQEERSASTIAAKTKFATNSLDKSLPLLEDAVKNVDLKGFTDLNSIENYYRSHTSDPNFAKLNLAIQTVVTDYSALIARNGIPTDATRGAARDLLNTEMGKRGIQGVIDQMRKESQAQLSAAGKTVGRYEGNELPPAAVKKLKADPSPAMRKHFDAVFGHGAAAGALEE